MIDVNNLANLLKKVRGLDLILNKLEVSKIRYGLFAGAYVSLVTSSRVPTDVDFLIADDDFDKLSSIFSVESTNKEYGDFIYPLGDDSVEFSARMRPNGGGKKYNFRLTPLAQHKVTQEKVGSTIINICDPADTILLKAILQRGEDEGKHDLEDIKQLLKVLDIDKNYLSKRLIESDADERVFSVLRGFGLF